MRKLQIKLEILKALSQIAPMALMEQTLRTQVQILVSPTPVLSEMREALNELEGQRMIVGVRSEVEASLVKWSITDSGRAKLSEWGQG